jgi:hypothetical protein
MHTLKGLVLIYFIAPTVYICFAVLRGSLPVSLNVDLDDDRWRQASLSVRWGGLGNLGVFLLAPSAFLASAASTMELTFALFPARLHDVKDSGIDTAMSAWLRHASCSTTSTAPTPPFSTAQRAGTTFAARCKRTYCSKLRSTCRSSSLARRMFSRFRCLARGPSTVQCRSVDDEQDGSHRRRCASRCTCSPSACPRMWHDSFC